MLTDRLGERDVREDLGGQARARPAHHGVGGRDDERLEPWLGLFERPQHGLGAVATVDITPQVPLAEHGVVVERAERGIVLRVHHVGEAQRRDAQQRIPAHQLDGHLLFEVLHERIGALGPGRVLLVDGNIGRVDVEWQTEGRLARSIDDRLDSGPAGGLKNVVGREHVVVERGHIGQKARGRDGPEVHDGVESVCAVVDAEHHVDDLAIVGQVDRGESRTARSRAVEVGDEVALVRQARDNAAPKLATTTGNGDSHEHSLTGRAISFASGCCRGRITPRVARARWSCAGRTRPGRARRHRFL